MTGRLLTLTEASRFLGCSVATVRRRVQAGALPVVIDGGLYRILESDLRAYIQARRRAPAGRRGTGPRTRHPPLITPPTNPRTPGRVRKLWEDGNPE